MSSHQDLVMEMPSLEKMSIPERLKHARKRRAQQLKRFQQYERELQKKSKKLNSQGSELSLRASHDRKVSFAENIQLLEAAARGDLDEVRELLNGGVDPNTGNEDGLTALHQSCIDNNEGMMKVLLDFGADVNITDRELWTPLHAASTCGHMKLAQTLVTRGADLLAINSDGNMPYDICEDEATLDYIESQMAAQGITQEQIDDLREVAPNQMLEDMKRIQEAGGSFDFRDSTLATPLHIAVAQGFEKVVVYLLDQGANVHAEDKDGWQPIHAAACWAQAEIISILVDHGADLDARTSNNETPLSLCEDDDIKSLIHQLKTETANRTRVNQLIRRSSSRKNRGSSVRRSSKREKGEMRKMDAKGEAAYIQAHSEELPSTNIDDIVSEGQEDAVPDLNQGTAESTETENGPSNPDVVLTDEVLPRSELSIHEEEDKEEEKPDEQPETTETVLNGSEETFSTSSDDPRSGEEPRRLKSILKKTPPVEPEEPKVGKKSKKEEEKLKEERLKEKEKEKQRLKEEKEKEKQKEKEEKLRAKEQKKKSKRQSLDSASPAENGGEDNIGTPPDESLGSYSSGGDTLPELKRQRQLSNSPLHKKSGSPSVSLSSSDNNGDAVHRREVQNGPSTKGHRLSSPSIASRLRLSLPFVGSYNFQDNSEKNGEQKRNSLALNGQENAVSGGEVNGHEVSPGQVEVVDRKRFSGSPEGLPEEETSGPCCTIM